MSNPCCAVVLLLFLPASSFAHDYWLEPESFRLPSDETIALRFFVGEKLTFAVK